MGPRKYTANASAVFRIVIPDLPYDCVTKSFLYVKICGDIRYMRSKRNRSNRLQN